MPRIFADLPDEDIQWLERLAAERGGSVVKIPSMIIRWARQHIESSK